jgi:hypothetical protein
MDSIIEMAVYLAAMAILTVYSIREDIQKHRTSLLATEGQNEAVIADALGSWASEKYSTLLAQYAQTGNAALTAPTVADLQTAGNLKQTYRAGPFWGGSYMIQLSMLPKGCTQDAGNCHVSWIFYPSLPYTRDGKPDVSGAAQIALAASAQGGQFGYSSTRNPATISGINGAWKASNPLTGTPAAAILATNGPNADGNSLFIRRDGSLTWTGDQNVNGVSMHNINSIDATGMIAVPLVSASDVAVTNAIRTPNALYVKNAAGTAPAPVNTGNDTVNGTLQVSQTIQPGAVATPRTYCPTNGAAATNGDGRGQWLSCQDHVWLPIGGPAQRYYYYNQITNGTVVPAPNCMGQGAPQIVISHQSFQVDTTATLNVATQGTGPWTVLLTDGKGAASNETAEAETYCAY